MTIVLRYLALVGFGLLTTGCDGPTAPQSRAARPGEDDPLVRFDPTAPAPDLLKAGTRLPDFKCEGWINGPPPSFGPDAPPVTVIDLWSTWCPNCQSLAPGLVAIHRKYADRGVQFISVTNAPKGVCQGFVRRLGITWPAGYGLSDDSIRNLLATVPVGSGIGSGDPLAPTIYIVNKDGIVHGSDEGGRWRHLSMREIAHDLQQDIEEVLAAAKGIVPN